MYSYFGLVVLTYSLQLRSVFETLRKAEKYETIDVLKEQQILNEH